MLVHFIFVVKDSDLNTRKNEFEYVKKMAQFFKVWIKDNFSEDVDIQCDEMITAKRSILQRLDIPILVKDQIERGENIFHFYLCHFRPIWTDCACDGYHAENFGMVWWQRPKDEESDMTLFLAEKNCTAVSHELSHELLRQSGNKKYVDLVHDTWTKHHFSDLPFERYDKNHKKTQSNGICRH